MHKRAWLAGFAAIAAREGFAACTIDYRLLPGVTPVECLQDAKAAVRFIHANADRYGIDADRIGACGGSAGAQLATALATIGRVQAAVGFATPALTGRRTWPIRKLP